MALMNSIREAQRARGTASILAIGTATPPNCFYQSDFPDFYFRATKSEHKTQLKDKFKRVCANSGIRKRHLHLTEDMLEKNPSLYTNGAPSFDIRLDMLKGEIPELGKAAALEAIKEWGRPVSKITHLVFATSSDRIESPSADFHLAKLLGLAPSVRRHMIYQQGCFAAGAALRLSKDLAENNAGARILVVCAENTVFTFSTPSTEMLSMLIGMTILGDGAAAAIVGADIDACEKPLFQMVSAAQTFLSGTEDAIVEELRESGSLYWLSRDIPSHVGGCVEKIMKEAFAPFGISDWNSLFYAVHPGGRAVLDRVQESLRLGAEKLEASRHVLSEYGNMRAPTVLFALDEVRKKAAKEQKATTGDGLEWGVLMAFGPGITVETIVLHSEVSA